MSDQVVNLFDMEADDASMDFLNKRPSNKDGIFRASPKDAADKNKGYTATIRFLPNLQEDGTLGASAIEKHVHYAKLPEYADLQGYYDSLVNFGEKCPLTAMFWTLKNSKNQAEVERADLISRTTKYYSYIQIIEDEQHRENEGKIMIFPFGFKIKGKIDAERNGENAEAKKCNVFDPANGKDFKLIVKEIGGFPNYDSSIFRATSPLKLWDEKNTKFITIPVERNEEKDKNVITNAGVQKKVVSYLSSTELNLSDHEPKKWTEEEKVKVDRIIAILSGKDVSAAKSSITETANSTSASGSVEDSSFDDADDDINNFFGDEE